MGVVKAKAHGSSVSQEAPGGSTAQESRQLALLGAKPVFDNMVVVGQPNVLDRQAFLARIESMLDSKQLTNFGPMSRAFERQVADIMHTKHCISMCNGTIAIELAAGALGLKGDVIVPSYTFVATVHALLRQNLRPVFCDVDPATHTLDPAQVEAAITADTSAILSVSLWGNFEGEGALRDIADRHGLALIYDSAHSFGCARENGSRNQLCDLEILSFHATKCIHAIEGGAILTNDDDLAEKLRLMANFGFAGEDNVVRLGTNAKMSEASAAMGLTSLDSREAIFSRNRDNHAAYAAGLTGLPGLRLMTWKPDTPHNFQYIVIEVDADQAGVTRDELVATLRLENVLARRYFHPGCHRMKPYDTLFPDAGQRLPVTEVLSESVMVLPNGMAVTPEIAARICERIATIVEHSDQVRAALKTCQDPKLPEFMKNK